MEWTLIGKYQYNKNRKGQEFTSAYRSQNEEVARFARDLFSQWDYRVAVAPNSVSAYNVDLVIPGKGVFEGANDFANEEAARFLADLCNASLLPYSGLHNCSYIVRSK